MREMRFDGDGIGLGTSCCTIESKVLHYFPYLFTMTFYKLGGERGPLS